MHCEQFVRDPLTFNPPPSNFRTRPGGKLLPGPGFEIRPTPGPGPGPGSKKIPSRGRDNLKHLGPQPVPGFQNVKVF